MSRALLGGQEEHISTQNAKLFVAKTSYPAYSNRDPNHIELAFEQYLQKDILLNKNFLKKNFVKHFLVKNDF